MENLKTIALTTDEVSYLIELLNNERYTSNNNATLAESLITVLHDTQSLGADDLHEYHAVLHDLRGDQAAGAEHVLDGEERLMCGGVQAAEGAGDRRGSHNSRNGLGIEFHGTPPVCRPFHGLSCR